MGKVSFYGCSEYVKAKDDYYWEKADHQVGQKAYLNTAPAVLQSLFEVLIKQDFQSSQKLSETDAFLWQLCFLNEISEKP